MRPVPRAATAVLAAALTIAAAGGLAGCATAQPAGGAQSTGEAEPTDTAVAPREATPGPTDLPVAACVDWVRFGTPVEAAADAGAVLRGTVVEQDGTAQMYGVEANRWLVDVHEVLERPDPPSGRPQVQPEHTVSPGERVSVVSTPETCSGDAYPAGDPLDPASGPVGADGSVILLLSAASGEEGDVGGFHLITPYQGVLTPTSDGALPSEWPVP